MNPHKSLNSQISIKEKISSAEIISYIIFFCIGLIGIYSLIKEFNIPILIGSLGLIFVSLFSMYNTLRSAKI